MTSRAVFSSLALAASSEALVGGGQPLVNDPEFISRLNSVPESMWIAASHPLFDGRTMDDLRVLLGAHLSHISEHLNETRPDSVYAGVQEVPGDFDARTHWPGLIHPIRDQQQCGSCWAFSASEVLSDRVAIASGTASPVLSAEDLVSCDRGDSGCNGGQLPAAWKYLHHTGLVTDACYPYTAGQGSAPRCRSSCANDEAFARTKASSAYAINGVDNMQKDLLMHGPIQVGFQVYRSFMNYKSGIYHKHLWEVLPEGGHAVKMVGWGLDSTVKSILGGRYWVVANSWGPAWGEQGFFRIVRGWNHCNIEKMGPPYAGLVAAQMESSIVV